MGPAQRGVSALVLGSSASLVALQSWPCWLVDPIQEQDWLIDCG